MFVELPPAVTHKMMLVSLAPAEPHACNIPEAVCVLLVETQRPRINEKDSFL
jgi:hypothetical protein